MQQISQKVSKNIINNVFNFAFPLKISNFAHEIGKTPSYPLLRGKTVINLIYNESHSSLQENLAICQAV